MKSSSISQDIAHILLSHHAVFLNPENPFTWTSGLKSPIYCDNRLLISSVEAREIIVKTFIQLIHSMSSVSSIDVIAGCATAGIPWSSWISWELKKPMVYVRSSLKEHGRKKSVEGATQKGQKVILIEDLVSTGKSSIEAVQELRKENVIVENVICLFTYNFPETIQRFNEHHLSLTSLTTFEDLINYAHQEKRIHEQQFKELLSWKNQVKIF